MDISKVHTLFRSLVDSEWDYEFIPEGDQEAERFAEALRGIYRHARSEEQAIYAFFEFVADRRGSGHKWSPEELSTMFNISFRGASHSAKALGRQHFIDAPDPVLTAVANNSETAEYFDWVQYIKDRRPKLVLTGHGARSYLFEHV